jgi:hypothetical protein
MAPAALIFTKRIQPVRPSRLQFVEHLRMREVLRWHEENRLHFVEHLRMREVL